MCHAVSRKEILGFMIQIIHMGNIAELHFPWKGG